MGSGIGKILAKQAVEKSLGALERVGALERALDQLGNGVNQAFQNSRKNVIALGERQNSVEQIINALINLVGKDAVEAEVQRLHVEQSEERAQVEKAALEAALAEGKVVPANEVGPVSIIVGGEVDKDGNRLYPTRVQMLFSNVKEEFRAKLEKTKAGDVVETPNGGKFTITEVYDIVVNPPAGTTAAGATVNVEQMVVDQLTKDLAADAAAAPLN